VMLPPQTSYTNPTTETQRWASEGIIREKDQAIQWLIESLARCNAASNTR
jgi:hypothetical protein